MNKLLTIAIPTYNRNNILVNHLEHLIPQITNECFVLIIDNHSSIPVSIEVEKVFGKFKNSNYKIVENKVNIGASGNVMRCIELCETEWIWILGDDDLVEHDAISIILNDIKNYKNIINNNYSSPTPLIKRTKVEIVKGQNQFLEKMDYFGDFLFISYNIYNAKKIQDFLKFGVHYCFSDAPHFVSLLMALQNNEICVLSNKVIVKNDGGNTPKDSLGNVLNYVKGFSILYNLPLGKTNKKKLMRKVLYGTNKWFSAFTIIHLLLLEYYNDKESISPYF